MTRLALIAAAVVATLCASVVDRENTRAHDVPGEFSLWFEAPAFAFLGQTFTVTTGLDHEPGAPGYQLLDFRLGFAEAIVGTTDPQSNRDIAAPSACATDFLDLPGAPAVHWVMGCLDLGGANMTYAGPVWHVVFTCNALGDAGLHFRFDQPSWTEVWDSDAALPAHRDEGVSTQCIDYVPEDDSDGDGCTNAEELAGNAVLGGDRDPANPWDYYEVSGDGIVDLRDTLVVLQHFGHGPGDDPTDDLLDRRVLDNGKPWRMGESDSGIDLSDALNNLKSYGHHCN